MEHTIDELVRGRRRRALIAVGCVALWGGLVWLLAATAPSAEERATELRRERESEIAYCQELCSDPYCTLSFNPIPYEDINCVCTCDRFAEEVD